MDSDDENDRIVVFFIRTDPDKKVLAVSDGCHSLDF